MGNFVTKFRQDFSWTEFREDFKFMGHDLDVKQTLWGRKVRAMRPFILAYVGVSFTLSAWEMQYQLNIKSPEMDFYAKLREWFMPKFYDYLDLKPI